MVLLPRKEGWGTLEQALAAFEPGFVIERNRAALEGFLLPLEIADFDQKAAWKFGEIRSVLERAGKPIGPFDMQIAAHALALGCVVVTNTLREFQRVPGLKVENWAK